MLTGKPLYLVGAVFREGPMFISLLGRKGIFDIGTATKCRSGINNYINLPSPISLEKI